MKNKIINPFIYLSGSTTLLVGLAGLFLSAFLSVYSKTHLDGVLDVHYGSTGDFGIFILENVSSWASLILAFGLIGLLVRGFSFRILDLAGYTAFMRIPLIICIILPLFLDGSAVADSIIHQFLGIGEPVEVTTLDIVSFVFLTLLTILFIFWMLAWGYYAFRLLFNTGGLKGGILYFSAILLAEVFAKIFLIFVFDIPIIQT